MTKATVTSKGTLSLLYRVEMASLSDTLRVILAGPTQTISATLPQSRSLAKRHPFGEKWF